MAEKKRNTLISYDAAGSRVAFPLDYSQKEIENTEKLREDDDHLINRATLRDLVCENPVFNEFFHWLRYDNPSYTKPHSNAVPVELWQFIKLYMREIMSDSAFSSSIRDGIVPDGMERPFYSRLMEVASREEQTANIGESELYWTRHLFENVEFQNSAVQNLWDKEFNLRVHTLNELVKKLTPEQQLRIFQTIIVNMDNQIVLASQYRKWNGFDFQKKGMRHFLSEFPKSVISRSRNRVVGKTKEARISYQLDNCPLSQEIKITKRSKKSAGTTTVSYMEDAFRKICGNAKDSQTIKKVARGDYLQRLNLESEKSGFQRGFEFVLEYINTYAEGFDLEQLRHQIAIRAAVYFGAAFRGENPFPGHYRPDKNGTFPQGEVNGLIESMVSGYYNSFGGYRADWLMFISNSLHEVDRMTAWYKHHLILSGQDENYAENEELYQKELAMYLGHLREIMPGKLESRFIIGEKVLEDQMLLLAEEIVELCQNAVKKLDIIPPVWLNKERLGNAIYRYNTILSEKKGWINFPGFLEYDVNLRQALIICKFEEAFDDCCRNVEEQVLSLTTVMRDMKNNQL